jgi:hypothetical protein
VWWQGGGRVAGRGQGLFQGARQWKGSTGQPAALPEPRLPRVEKRPRGQGGRGPRVQPAGMTPEVLLSWSCLSTTGHVG